MRRRTDGAKGRALLPRATCIGKISCRFRLSLCCAWPGLQLVQELGRFRRLGVLTSLKGPNPGAGPGGSNGTSLVAFPRVGRSGRFGGGGELLEGWSRSDAAASVISPPSSWICRR